MNKEIKTQVAVLGAGPAGYSAAFRCADLDLDTILIERYTKLGGVCLNVGCIPSKALLHISKVIEDTQILAENGIVSGKLKTNLEKIQTWKKKIINKLTDGLSNMAKDRKVRVINGTGKFTSTNTLVVDNVNSSTTINFDHAIIATGSYPIQLPFIQYRDPRIWDSTSALELKAIPKRMLIIGGGIIGLEIGTIYHALGSEIDIVEISDQLIPEADRDIVNILDKSIRKKFNLFLKTKITSVQAKEDGIYVSMEGILESNMLHRYDTILVAIGRTPNSNKLDADKVGIEMDERGFIIVNNQMRTSIPHIYAIGDIVGQPMLAHKSIYEGHLAAEVIAGKRYYFDPKVIPSIAYTDPEIAWVGVTEKKAKETGINYEIASFPWSASGRAVASNCSNGLTKLIFDKKSHRIIGGATVGSNGGELLGEISLAIEMGCDAEDISLTIHAHPTLHESICLAAKIFAGSITDLPNLKNKNFNIL